MANNINEDGALHVSKLNMNGTTYTLKDAWARAEIAEIEQAIGGGIHFRGVSTTAIADGDTVKDLTVGGKTYAAADQETGDIFIYNNSTKNLEFIVVGGKYSELGSTGQLGAFAYADQGAGSVVLPLSSSIAADDIPTAEYVQKGTLGVSYQTGTVTVESTDARAEGAFKPADVTIAAQSCDFVTADAAASATVTFSPAAITVAAKACEIVTTTLESTNFQVDYSPAAVTMPAQACTVTTTKTAATAAASFSPAAITVAASAVTITPTTGTFTALQNVTYDSATATLSISDGTSEAFWKGYTSAQAAGQTVTQPENQTVTVSVSYDKIAAVTAPQQVVTPDAGTFNTLKVSYDTVYEVTCPGQTITQDANQSATATVTYVKVNSVTAPEFVIEQDSQTIAVTYKKAADASGTFLTSASLTGDLAVTNIKPTLTITNPTVTVTVSPAS